jgi:hypothetical protein
VHWLSGGALVYGKPALPTLEGVDLLETLVPRGVDRERAKDLIAGQDDCEFKNHRYMIPKDHTKIYTTVNARNFQ